MNIHQTTLPTANTHIIWILKTMIYKKQCVSVTFVKKKMYSKFWLFLRLRELLNKVRMGDRKTVELSNRNFSIAFTKVFNETTIIICNLVQKASNYPDAIIFELLFMSIFYTYKCNIYIVGSKFSIELIEID